MRIEPFAVEMWMNEWETRCRYNLAETCVDSITIEELLKMSGQNSSDLSAILAMKMTYGAIEGSDRLRAAIADLFDHQSTENITVTHGTIAANMLVHKALVERNDHVVAIVPTYQQHYSIPESIGANVETLELLEENSFLPDLEELRGIVHKKTKLIALTNPNNPTGALMDEAMLLRVAEIARSVGAYVLCDEVYRGTDQTGTGLTASIADLYEKGISTGSTSKAFSLAGLRLGWIVGPQEVQQTVMIHRDYDTISVGMINDYLACLALENRDKILARSQQITRDNLVMLEDWVANEPRISWVKPNSGTTAMLKFDLPVTSRELCIDLLEKTGVMFTPGDAFGMDDHIRIGFGNSPVALQKGLQKVSKYLTEHPA